MPVVDPRTNDPTLVWLVGCLLPAAAIALGLALWAMAIR